MFQFRFGELKGEILGKARQVGIHHDFLSPNHVDQGFDELRGAALTAHRPSNTACKLAENRETYRGA